MSEPTCSTCGGSGRVKVFNVDAVVQEYDSCPDCDYFGNPLPDPGTVHHAIYRAWVYGNCNQNSKEIAEALGIPADMPLSALQARLAVTDDELAALEGPRRCVDCGVEVSIPFFIGSGGQCPDCLADCAILPLTQFKSGES